VATSSKAFANDIAVKSRDAIKLHQERLGFFAPFLVGKTDTDSDDVTFVVESLSRSQQAVVSSSNPVEKRTISQLDAFKEIIKSSKYGYGKRRYSLFVKTVSVALYNPGAKYLEAMGEAQKALKNECQPKEGSHDEV